MSASIDVDNSKMSMCVALCLDSWQLEMALGHAASKDSRGQPVENGGIERVLTLFNDTDSDLRRSAAGVLAKLATYGAHFT